MPFLPGGGTLQCAHLASTAASMWPLLFVVLGLVFLCLWIAERRKRYWASRGVRDAGFLQFLRNTLRMYYTPVHLIWEELYRKHGPIVGTFTTSTPTLMVADPELLSDIMVKNFACFPNTQFIRQVGDPVLDNMLVSLMDDQWRATRSVVSPVFSTSKIKQMVATVSECTKDTLRNFAHAAAGVKPCNVKLIFGAFGLDVIAQTTFSFRLDSHRDVDNPFVLQAKRFFSAEHKWRAFVCFQFPWLSTLLGVRIFCPEAVQYFSGVMTNLLKRRADNMEDNVRPDFVRLLLDAECKDEDGCQGRRSGRRVLSKDQVLAQAVLFFVAGYDTTTNAMSMAVYHLAHNRHAQARLIREIEDALAKHGVITHEVVMGLEYLDAVVMETLRINPPVHMFLGENKRAIVPFSYLPFGEGPRQCIGMRFALLTVKLCLFHVLSRFSFEPCPETATPPKYHPSILVLTPYEVKLKVIDRQQSPEEK
ncbi:cytochrome P450 3A16-like isoform X2 [Haemaphysalis longicornis]